MAEGKKTFIFYSDWINMVREMPNEDAGQLIKHVLSYVNDENPNTDNLLVKMAFGHMKPMLKADLDKWEKIKEKRKKAGAKGGKQTQANAKQMLQVAKQVQAVNDNVNVINIYKEEIFIENWSKCREHYLKKPTGIKNLNFLEKAALKNALSNYNKEEINEAMITLFQQENILNESMRLRPLHFLEKIDTYYTGIGNKNIWSK